MSYDDVFLEHTETLTQEVGDQHDATPFTALPGTASPSAMKSIGLLRYVTWTLSPTVVIALLVFLVLIICRNVFNVPKPLIFVLGSLFIAWLLISAKYLLDTATSVFRATARLLVPWVFASTVLYGGVFYFDRAGWLWYHISGFNTCMPEILTKEILASARDFVREHPDFVLDSTESTRVHLPRGEYVFNSTIVFPKNATLIIDPGAHVKLSAGVSLISYGSLIAVGTSSNRISFRASGRWSKWGVVGVIGAEQSVFEFCEFENGRQAFVNGIDLPGGLSFIDTSGSVSNCSFVKMCGKDAVYCYRSNVIVFDNRIQLAFKDGIDYDNSTGEIRGNVIVDCEDEGIDLSGNMSVNVHRNIVRDQKGGRVAATHDLDRIRLANVLEHSHGK